TYFAEPFDPSRHDFAALHGTDALRRTRHDDVPGLKCHRLRTDRDDVRHGPDQLRDVGVLLEHAVDGQPDAPGFEMPDLRDRPQRSDRCREIKTLAPVPGTALLTGLKLEIPAGQIDADAVAPDMIERALDRDVGPALPDRDDQLDFVVKVLGQRRIRNGRS